MLISGNMLQASYWSAFAIKHSQGSRVQVEVNGDNLKILIDGTETDFVGINPVPVTGM